MNRGVSVAGGRMRLLLGSACVSALLLGTGMSPAFAACAINDVGNSAGAGPFNNTTNSINCINIQNSNVNGGTGNVSNTAPGVIITAKTVSSFATGIRINNSTLTGSVINTGTITATTGTANGIVIISGASVAGGITNSGTIRAVANGIVDGVDGFGLAFSAGVTNTGTIVATGFLSAGISSAEVSTFTGGVSNGGVISANLGITLSHFSTFSGGINNTGTITGTFTSLGLPIGISVDGTGHVAGASPATFIGGITNLGTISGGVGVEDLATFAGGNLSNNGTISSTKNGIVLTNIVTFAGNITNSGTVSVAGVGIFVGLTPASSGGVTTFTGNVVNSGSITAQTGISIVDATINGQILNSGNVQASGHGLLIDSTSRIVSTATAVNITSPTFTGGVTNAGAITTSGATGIEVNQVRTFTGGLANSGTIAANTHALSVSTVTTFAGGISNNGTLTANNSVLLVSNVAVFGTNASGGITNSGTIAGHTAQGINVLNVTTFNGGIVNSGLINAARTGISVASVTSFAGGITNSAGGTIAAAANGIFISSGVTFAAGSAINNAGVITGASTAINLLFSDSPVTINQTGGSIGGAIELSSSGNDVVNISGGVVNGNIVGFGGSTVNFNLGAGNTFTYNSTLNSIQQVNINSGTAVLNGINFVAAVAVNSGGILAGTGPIEPAAAVTINSGGTFSPGTPGTPGTSMSITGTLVFQPGATYRVYLNPSATSSATINGTASLNGTVQANFAAGSYVSRSYDILHATSLGGTTFTGLTTVPNFNASLTYTTTDVFLNLTAGLGQGTTLTVNQQNVATTLNTFFNNGGALPPGFAAVFGLSGTNLAAALNQLDGEVATGAQRAAFQGGSEFLSLLIDPFVYGRGDALTGAYGGMLGFAPDQANVPADVALAYASVLKAPLRPPTFDQRWTAWGSVYGGQASAKADPNVIGSTNVTTGTFGFAGGMDYRVSADTVVGFGLGAGGTGWGLAQSMGNGRSDAFQSGTYGATHWGPAYAAAAVAFAENWMHTSRTALGDQLTADFEGQSAGTRLEAGYRYPVALGTAMVGISPYAALQTQWFHTPGYSERDSVPAGFGLTYQAKTANDTRSELGARADELVTAGGMPLLLRARLAWAHDWVSDPALTAVFQTLPGTNFVVFGAPIAHDTALASLGAELRITSQLNLIAKVDGEFGGGSQTYAGSATLRYKW